MEKRTLGEEESMQLAGLYLAGITPKEGEATVVGLNGDLGSGKTVFARGVARALGIFEHITSPTFVLEKIYDCAPGSAFEKLIHIDAYRLEGGEALAPLRFEELLKQPRTLILLEWPELVESALPKDTKMVKFKVEGEDRVISW